MKVEIIDVESTDLYPLSEIELGVDIVWFIKGLLSSLTIGLEKSIEGLLVGEPLCEEVSVSGILSVYIPVSLLDMEPMCVRVAHVGAGYWQWSGDED